MSGHDVTPLSPAFGAPQASVVLPPVAGLRRPQLLRALDPVAADALGLVVAPAGTGKTTLLAQWAAALGLPVAWCRLDVGAGAPGRFVSWLWQALSEHVPVAAFDAPRTVEELVRTLEPHRGRLLLVLDDAHTLASSSAEHELEQLLLLAPPQLRVLIGARQMPRINLARSELAPIVLLSGEDLRFRTWEVEKLFRAIHRAPLPPQDVAALTRRTQGWAAALQLFHLATMDGDTAERQRAVAALAGRSRYAQGYLTGQVLAGLPPETTDFLVRTCIFDALTAARCDALLERRSSQRILRDLVDRQALTTTIDGGETFTYHEVLRRHLEATLHEELGAVATREWYQRAAAILEDEGDVVEALRTRCRAEDWTGVRRLLREFGPQLLDDGRLTRSGDRQWSDLLPRSLVESDPWSCLAEARRLLNDGRLTEAAAMSRRAQAQLADPLVVKLCEEVRATVTAWRGQTPSPRPGWIDLLLSATRQDPLRVAQAARDASSPRARRVEGFARLLGGDRRAGQRQLRLLAEQHETDLTLSLAARLTLAAIRAVGAGPAATTGRGHDNQPLPGLADSSFDQIYRDAERHGLTWLARLTSRLADVLASPRAGREIAGPVADLDQRSDEWAAALAGLVHALVGLRGGVIQLRALDDLRRRFRRLDAGVLEAWVAAFIALVSATEHLPDATETARAAEAQTRAAGVPGAAAFTYAALAAADPDQRSDFLALARSTASASGLACRPWAWRPDMAPWHRAPRPPQAAARTGAAVIAIACFGEFQLLVRDRPTDLAGVRPRVRAMFKFLAIHAGHPVHRELIADALWGDLEPEAAMHNLQVSLSSLRAALEPGVPGRRSSLVIRDGETYMLALRPGSRCDLVTFDRELAAAGHASRAGDAAVQRAALSAAVALYTGDIFPEEGPADWLVTTRERYRARAADAAARLAGLELAAADHSGAITAARRAIELDEYRDDAWQHLIEALRGAGEPAAAQRAVRAYAVVLDELGVSPGDVSAPGTPPRRSPRAPAGSHRMPRGS